MKVQNIIRMQLATVGFGAALFFASTAPAQEITNTEWPDRPGATEPLQSAPAQASDATNSAAAVQVGNANNAASKPATQTAGGASQQVPAEGGWITTLLVLSFAGATAYSLAGLRRSDRAGYARIEHAAKSISLS